MKGKPLTEEDKQALIDTEDASIFLVMTDGTEYVVYVDDILATIDTLKQQVAEQQAAIERLREALKAQQDLDYDPSHPVDQMADAALDATQHDGQALRDVRAEAWDAGEKVGRDCGMHAARAAAGISQLGPFFVANPHRQPQANHPATTTTDEEGS